LRTLVISDLHLGNRAQRDVARLDAARSRLLEALDGVDRLVVLGDLAELMNRHPRRSLEAAEPVVRDIGRRLGSGREVLLIPGNHDAPLVRAWVRSQGRELATEATVPTHATPALSRVASWLSPATVSVKYPGAWLDDGVWATHGHYLDRHLFPESAFGLLRPARGRDAPGTARPSDYERSRSRRGREPLPVRFVRRPLATTLEAAGELVRAAALPALPNLLMNARLAPVNARIIDLQMRRAAIPAIARVVRRLGVSADWVVFGHVHRAGPLEGEDTALWMAPRACPDGPAPGDARFVNTGSWLYEPLLVDRITPPHPYWPGGAVLLESGSAPRAVNLLTDLAPSDLRPPGARSKVGT
jgi:UDP-2,3-diacylglucosamine pyrophosphatase LpxH